MMVANILASGSIGQFHAEMPDMVRNPFRTKFMRGCYHSGIKMYAEKHRNLVSPRGRRCVGNAFATAFWRGFDGIAQNWDTYSKQTGTYAAWRAGSDIKAAIDRRVAA